VSEIRWAIIGAGDIAEKRMAGALQTARGSVLHAVVRRDEQKLKAFAAKYGVPKAYTDAAREWSDPDDAFR
jgi:predicted dehydrogenase